MSCSPREKTQNLVKGFIGFYRKTVGVKSSPQLQISVLDLVSLQLLRYRQTWETDAGIFQNTQRCWLQVLPSNLQFRSSIQNVQLPSDSTLLQQIHVSPSGTYQVPGNIVSIRDAKMKLNKSHTFEELTSRDRATLTKKMEHVLVGAVEFSSVLPDPLDQWRDTSVAPWAFLCHLSLHTQMTRSVGRVSIGQRVLCVVYNTKIGRYSKKHSKNSFCLLSKNTERVITAFLRHSK